jgi:hypothetical protein
MGTVSSQLPAGKLRFSARVLFAFGLILMVAGSIFLLASWTSHSKIAIAVSFISIIIGILLSIGASALHKRSTYIFFSSYFILFGLFFLLRSLDIVPVSFREAWPVLSIFAGLSFIPAGWYRYHSFHMNWVICCLCFTCLGVLLLCFSLHIIDMSFKAFILQWWPLLLLFLGLVLVLCALSSRRE